jgi:two-component system sensor histidine kinase SenX3
MLIDIYRYKNGNKRLYKGHSKVSELITRSIGQAKALANARQVSLVTRLGYAKEIYCDANEFTTLISHVAENAVRYARQKVIIETAELGGHVLIRVCDDGEGIGPADAATLFDRFYTGSEDGRYPSTTGTGLCLCSEIIKAHGGTITCTSEEGHGSIFTLALPAAGPAKHEPTLG